MPFLRMPPHRGLVVWLAGKRMGVCSSNVLIWQCI